MKGKVYIYKNERPEEIEKNTDYLRLHASLEPGHLRLTPSAIKRVCEQYTQITLELPLTTNDAYQQGKEVIQQSFLLELFRHWTEKLHTTLIVKRVQEKSGSNLIAEKHVTSVQVWNEKSLASAEKIARSYFRFLPVWTKRIIISEKSKNVVRLSLFRIPLLELCEEKDKQMPEEVSSWIICGGLMTHRSQRNRGRLWFVRSGVKPGVIYAAITHYKPALPWFLYLSTQAAIHHLVMHRFAAWRNSLTRSPFRRDL
jgi:hypothetical protein